MFFKLCKKGITLSIATLAMTSAGYADSYSDSCCTPCPCPCPCGDNDDGFFVGASYLYWTAYASDFNEKGGHRGHSLEGYEGGYSNGTSLEYEWDSGYRLLGGYRFCDGFDVGLVWTYWSDTSSHSKHINVGSSDLTDTSSDVGVEGPKLSFKREVKYKVLDLQFGQKYAISCKLSARPHFGLRGVWFEQNRHFKFDGETSNSVGDLEDAHWKSDFDALGLHAGFLWNYDWCDGFGLYGQFGGSIVAGKNRKNERGSDDDMESSDAVGSGNGCRDRHHEHHGLPGLNLGIGLSWEHDWSCGSSVLAIGYEMNHWGFTTNGNRSVSGRGLSSDGAFGNVLLHGLTITLAGGF